MSPADTDAIFTAASRITAILFGVVISMTILSFLMKIGQVRQALRPYQRTPPKRPRYQFISWRQWIGVGLYSYAKNETGMAQIYEWSLELGFVEIRKWRRR